MKRNILIIITIIYFSLSLLFNYSLYPLLITNENSNQYFLIFIYFLSELISFFFLILTKKKEKIISSTLGPKLSFEESMNNSSLSETYNNATTNMNISGTLISVYQPFIGMKWPSFIIPSILDFFSKFFIFNGLKILENDIILRAIVELFIIFFFSKIILQSKFIRFSIVGVIIIFCSLIVVCFYCQISRDIKLYFKYNNYGIIGILLCVVGEIFNAIQIFLQVKFIRIGEKHSCREIGWEGVFGVIISFILFQFSLIFPFYENDDNKDEILNKKFWYYCKDNDSSSISNLFNDIRDNIPWYFIFFLVSIFYNLTGIIMNKYIGEVYRSNVNVARLSIIMILVLRLHNDVDIGVVNSIICALFFISNFLGLFLSIILRKQRDITFEDRASLPEIYLKDDYEDTKIIEEDNH